MSPPDSAANNDASLSSRPPRFEKFRLFLQIINTLCFIGILVTTALLVSRVNSVIDPATPATPAHLRVK